TELASAISVKLAKPIKIQSLAKNGYALHRTLHELRALVQWPQILIYQGASEEFNELKFNPENAAIIKKNFAIYKDDRVETALIIFPWLSRLIYEPHPRIKLEEAPVFLEEVTEENYIARLETELLLFEQQLIQLVHLSKDRNTLLILSTTPLNLDIAPKKVCEFAVTTDLEKDLMDINEQLNANNPKAAFASSSKLVQRYTGNAQLFFTHGQILNRLGKVEQAKKAMLQATAYDCNPWRATEVYNSIIRKVARNHQVILFDFSKQLENQWNKNTTFFDELYPQNLYYDQGMKQLGLVIKQILKL
ncbi:MAG: hypothetical protein H0V66_13695, partial [Bdellovibrionales bacterium]|nr:hypothetical protein [Bdellovibrionales bacterium]